MYLTYTHHNPLLLNVQWFPLWDWFPPSLRFIFFMHYFQGVKSSFWMKDNECSCTFNLLKVHFSSYTIDVCLCFRTSAKTNTGWLLLSNICASCLCYSCILKYPFILSVCREGGVCQMQSVNCMYVCSKCVCIFLLRENGFWDVLLYMNKGDLWPWSLDI